MDLGGGSQWAAALRTLEMPNGKDLFSVRQRVAVDS